MNSIPPFTFTRARGIVWVCDLTKSSSYLNSNDSVDDIENFIPRLYYVSKLIVESYGGIFLEWTGDGFLAFFQFELDRHKNEISAKVFEAAWHLSFMSNVTQFGLKPKRKFKIRHGITYEKDALLMKMNDENETDSFNIIGRSVVLAFRLSGIQSEFPSIVTVKEIVTTSICDFVRWKPSKEDILKYFKGEKFGIESIVISSDKVRRPVQRVNSVKRSVRNVIKEVESGNPLDSSLPIIVFTKKMVGGPDWCNETMSILIDFIREGLLNPLKELFIIINKPN